MFGLFFIYFIGKAYYDLARHSGKKKWLYAILGALSFYVGIFVAAIFITALNELGIVDWSSWLNENILSLMCIPFGLLTCFGYYHLLRKRWVEPKKNDNPDVLDSDLI